MKINKRTKLKVLYFLILLILTLNINAQVTVGSNVPPNKGSILDLKEESSVNANSTRGLALPRVNLTNESRLYPMFPDNYTDLTLNSTHIGLTVYNVNPCEPFGKGVFVWNGSKWEPIGALPPIYKPANPILGGQQICIGTSTTLTYTPDDPEYEVKWYDQPSGGTATTGTSLNTGILNANKSYYLALEHKSGLSCGISNRTEVIVAVVDLTQPTLISNTVNLCYGKTTNLNDLVSSATSNLKWYNATTNANITGTAITQAGEGKYYAKDYSMACYSPASVTVTVNVAADVAAPTASAQSFCGPTTIASLIATGTNIKWYTTTNGGTALATTTAIMASGTYYASQTSAAGCESARTPVSVIINTVPTAPTASTQSFCGPTTIASLIATGTNIKWYTTANGGTALATTTAITASGTYYASQTSAAGCESARTPVSVIINTVPTAPTASTQSFCGPTTIASLIATGTNIKWYTTANGGTALATTTAITASGTYYASQTSAAGCESARTPVSVIINTVPTAPTASTQSFCGPTTIASLIATGTNIKWYTTANGGTALATTTAITASGTYYASQTSAAGCESARTPVSVIINTVPTAPTASTQSFCGPTTIASLIATGTNIKWYTTANGGTALATTTAITASGTYYASQTSAAGCESARTPVSVIINTVPTAPTASTQSFCGPTTIASLIATGTNIKWYTTANGGTALATTTAITASGTYYASQTSAAGCESARRAVAVTINTIPAAPTASAQSFCGSTTVASLVATGTGTVKWYAAASGGSPLASTTAINTSGTYHASLTSAENCEGPRRAVVVTINPLPKLTSKTDVTSCTDSWFEYRLTTDTPCDITWSREALPPYVKKAGTTDTGPASGTGDEITEYIYNAMSESHSETVPITVTYTVTLKDRATGCTNTQKLNLTLVSVLSLTNYDWQNPFYINSGQSFSFAAKFNVPDSLVKPGSIKWERSAISQHPEYPAASGSGYIVNHTYINTTTTNMPVSYYVEFEMTNGCVGGQTVWVYVRPK
ncbi:hypothetical protein [uncultured Dysgonomonas sp.]|uniref:Ig-like domain-containing protein n=1 Tax=uncultured Dysgonomonas sp. TaxID=206096 RepID=A0A212JQ24_9BACT|nr:hypothetical protein [uncultured Dysgonomonas sp.]SBW01522.1 exported hypothetical protein [uncultured Dysgonomonas sp.]